MKIAVIGLGSMGKRRIRLIRELYPDIILVGVDNRTDRRQEVENHFGVPCCENLNQAGGDVDCVFVCTSPLSHHSIIKDALSHGCHVFTELNLVADGYEENMRLAASKGLVLFLSSTFFYREEIRYLHSQVRPAQRWNYIYHIGQYLPDWHPWERYQDFFLGDKRTNGCREILAIELPWIIDTFGDVSKITVASDKLTGLAIDYQDNYMIQLQHDGGNKGCLIVDVVSPCAVRNLEIYSDNAFFSWNGTPESLKAYNPSVKKVETVSLQERTEHMDGYRTFVVENAYKNEIRAFFSVLLEGKPAPYGFEQDMKILKLIDSIGA